MELVSNLFNMIILILVVLVSVAFMTLLERKFLSSSQIRKGPDNVGYLGLLQPFSDAIKLFSKESIILRMSNWLVYSISPIISLILMLMIWLMYPFFSGGLEFNFGLMYFICVTSLGVYPVIGSGWSSNCKYSILGSLRAVAQMVSYEVSLTIILLTIIWLSNSFNLDYIMFSQEEMPFLILSMPLSMIWLVSMLAETNRTPYDFSEGESELVSGFNTEYGSIGFSLIFMAEYGNIIFMSFFFVCLFMGKNMGVMIITKMMFFVVWFIWVRATLPRYRYDKLMSLAWKTLLPTTLLLFMFYFVIEIKFH